MTVEGQQLTNRLCDVGKLSATKSPNARTSRVCNDFTTLEIIFVQVIIDSPIDQRVVHVFINRPVDREALSTVDV